MNRIGSHRYCRPCKKSTARRTLPLILAVMLCVLTTLPTLVLAGQGSITVKSAGGREGVYDVYRIATANVDEAGMASEVAWESDAVRDATLAYLNEQGFSEWLEENGRTAGVATSAQTASEFLDYLIKDASGADEASSYATGLAQALASIPPTDTLRTNKAYQNETGMYLLVPADEVPSGASPMIVPITASPAELSEKAFVPIVAKELFLDAAKTQSAYVTSTGMGQPVPQRVTATLPDNIASYGTYHLRIDDTLSDGLTLAMPAGGTVADAVTVSIDGVEVMPNEKCVITLTNNLLTVDFPDLRSVTPAPAAGSVVTVDYDVLLTTKAAIGAEGNPNDAQLTYTANPVTGAEATSERVRTVIFCYQIDLTKVDASTGKALAGAKFTVADGSGAYVQEDGSLDANAYEFVTDASGKLAILHINEGVYTLHETQAPSGYDFASDATLTISVTLDEEGLALQSLEATAKGSSMTVTQVDPTTGTVSVQVADPAKPDAPEDNPDGGATGRLAQTGGGVVGIVLVAIGVAALLAGRMRSQSDGEKDEDS